MSNNFAVMVFAPGAGTKTAFTAAASAIQDGGSVGRVIITPDQDCHVRFGSASSGSGSTAVATDFTLWQKQTYIFDLSPNRRYFSFIRDSADGNAYWALVQ